MSDIAVLTIADRFRHGGQSFRTAFPGLLAAATVAMAATFLSEHYGGPVMLFALLLGIAFQFLSQEGRCAPGIQIASRNVLRIGVALLGARITVEQIMSLGFGPMIAVVAAVVLTVAFGALAGRALGLGSKFGVLSGGPSRSVAHRRPWRSLPSYRGTNVRSATLFLRSLPSRP